MASPLACVISCDGLIAVLLVQIDHHNLPAFTRRTAGSGLANAGTAAGHDTNLVAKSHNYKGAQVWPLYRPTLYSIIDWNTAFSKSRSSCRFGLSA